MRRPKLRRLLGFANIVMGGGIALVGLLLLLLWGIVGFTTSPRSPIYGCREVPFLGLAFLVCFGLVALSGVGLWRDKGWGFPVAVGACALVAAGGCVLFEAHLSSRLMPPWRLQDLVALCLLMAYEEVHVLILSYAVYPVFALLMLMASGNRRFTLAMLVVWALVGAAAGIFMANAGLDVVLQNLTANISRLSPLNLSQFIGVNAVPAMVFAQALIIVAAGFCAAVPRKRVRRVAWILYGALIPAQAWTGIPRSWSWLSPDIIFVGLGFGFGGLVVLGASQWLCREPGEGEAVDTVVPELAL